ncbi:MAG: ATP-dependent helicase [Deltaproteobacteria bacterium]|nr:MAG: ATP-dependent helicase [Deltaproteobacteria bacterium]
MRKYTLKSPVRQGEYSVRYEEELNPQQLEVVMAGNGPLLIIAGAGSGKTRVVTYRVARLIESGVSPSQILLVTFTNKAAREMLHRVGILIKADIRSLWGGTFHHIANLTLRRHSEAVGYSPKFTILDREDARGLLNACLTDLKINTKERRFPRADVLCDIISFSANTQAELEGIIANRYPYFLDIAGEIARIAQFYSQRKKKLNMMDFDDLLGNWKLLLEENPKIKEVYAEKFRHILVDEYQDTNKIQADIIDLLGFRRRNVMVVGDDSQSIYSFRGANFANIIEFPRRYPEAKIYKLETNYRSTPEILGLANLSITNNLKQFPKKLASVRGPGSSPVLIPLRAVLQQAEFVAQRILELREEGFSLNEIAVLYRSHYHSMELQMELTRRGIPFEVRSGLRFFEQAHIKDVTAYLRIVHNPNDELSWKRVVKLCPRIGNRTADKIWGYISSRENGLKAARNKELLSQLPRGAEEGWKRFMSLLKNLQTPEILKFPGQMIQVVLEEGYHEYLQNIYPNYQARLEDLNQLSDFAVQYDSLESFLSELALLSSVTGEDVVGGEDDEMVALSSVHQAKGLEWKVVLIIWLSEGRFPAAKALNDPEGEEEERRLFYVAATRAKDELYLCYPMMLPEGRYQSILLRPSRFIQELSETTYEQWQIDEGEDWGLLGSEAEELY